MTISELETDTHDGTDRRDFFAPGRNCWRVCDTKELAVVRDGAAYFRALREAMIAARRQVLLVGWDFDLEIELLPGESDETGLAPDGYPNMLQDFFEAIVAEKPELHIHLLRWTGSVVLAPGRLVPMARLSMLGSDRIQAAFDGRHPVGACHHQKIVVVDDQLAFCGGIDATDGRWDTPEHAPDDPRRRLRSGKDAMPWHDMTTALTGETARALGDLARTRWERATGQVLPVPGAQDDPVWPASLEVTARGVATAIARTEPPEADRPVVNEIETLLADTIRAAQSLIYLESQYFASEAVAEALGERLEEADGPEVIVISPQEAQSAIEDAAMHREREALDGGAAGARTPTTGSGSGPRSMRRRSRSTSTPRSASSTTGSCGWAAATSTAGRWPSTPNATSRCSGPTTRPGRRLRGCATGWSRSIWAWRPRCLRARSRPGAASSGRWTRSTRRAGVGCDGSKRGPRTRSPTWSRSRRSSIRATTRTRWRGVA
ncbi:MAG: hypothetical protein R3D59_03350 [Paracoccaceae bacterium]